MNKNLLYLDNILECTERIEDYTQNGEVSFMASKMMQDAVIRNLEIIGEATKCLSKDFRDTYTSVEWKKMAGVRDVLIHDYRKVRLDVVWQIVEEDISPLKESIVSIIKELEQQESVDL